MKCYRSNDMQKILLAFLAAGLFATTAHTKSPKKVDTTTEQKEPTLTQSSLRLWRNADLSTWKAYYTSTDTPDDGTRAITWNHGRYEVEATFYKNLKLCCINIEGKEGQNPLTFTEAKALGNSLGLPPYHMDDNTPTWGNSADTVTASFSDASFHFEADHANDPNRSDYDPATAALLAKRLQQEDNDVQVKGNLQQDALAYGDRLAIAMLQRYVDGKMPSSDEMMDIIAAEAKAEGYTSQSEIASFGTIAGHEASKKVKALQN
jgi:hypothetical protein